MALILGQDAIRVAVTSRLIVDSPETARGLFVLQGLMLHFDRLPLAVVIGASAALSENQFFRALCAFAVVLFILPTVAQTGVFASEGPVVTLGFGVLLLWLLATTMFLLYEVRPRC